MFGPHELLGSRRGLFLIAALAASLELAGRSPQREDAPAGSAKRRLKQAGRACAGATTLLGALGLLGWVTPWRRLASIDPDYIPMAPSTALFFLLLGSALLLDLRRPSPRRMAAVSLLVSIFAAVQLASFLAGLSPSLEALLVPDPEPFGNVLTARMSPLTSCGFLFAGLSLLLIALRGARRTAGDVAGGLASLVALLGLLATLGYVYGTPLLYTAPVVPMALPTALAFVCLGTALIALAGPDRFPLRPLGGPGARARMLRAFLPVAPVVILSDVLLQFLPVRNPALHGALLALLLAVVVTVAVSNLAHGLGGRMDQAEAVLRRSEERFRALVENSADGLGLLAADGTTLFLTPGGARILGLPVGEAEGRSFRESVHPDDQQALARSLDTVRARPGTPVEVEIRARHEDGSERVLDCTIANRLDEPVVAAIVCNFRDVTERKRAEKALRESEEKLRAFFDSGAVGILFGDVHGNILDANDAFLRITGYAREDLRAGRLRWVDMTPPEFRPLDETGIAEARARGACTPYEKQYVRKDGTRVWVLVGYVLLEPRRELSVAFVVDISAQREAEEARQRSEQRFASIFRSSPLGIGMSELSSGRLLEVNDRLAEFFGYAREEMIGRTVFELGLWADPADREAITARLRSGQPVLNMEVPFRPKSGDLRYALVSMEALTLPGSTEPVNVVVLGDISERKRLESQLLQAQKMEAVGRLAGGVAHDFNNLLGVITGYGELLMRQASEAQRGKIEQVLKAAQRGAGLTRQLLAFSRRQVLEPKVVDFNVLLADLGPMLRRVIGEDVDLAIQPGADLGHVKADPGQLEQVLMNLCVNARDAMPNGGRLCIQTENADLDESYAVRHEPVSRGRYVLLAVSDTGCGMDKETQAHIFEPFFTTKEQGKGTGLGLSTVYGIVKQSGGYVWVYSELGQGTILKIYLPRVDAPAEPLAADAPFTPSRGCETILLAEDELSLRQVTRHLLEADGYRVLEAGSGKDAVAVSEGYGEAIHLLIADVVMPGMDGRSLAERLTAMRPEMQVLYMSGYTDDIIAHHGVLEAGTLLLQKPFTAAALLRRVREALTGPRRRERS